MKSNIVLVVLSLMVTIFISEISLRIYYKNDYGVPTHRNWQFRKIWDEKYANLNSLGLRDHDFSVNKPENTFRILIIGDSLTWGEGIKNIDDIYPELIEKKLNTWSTGLKYEVLNLSHKGWNVQDYLNALREKGLTYNPDIVMLGFYINDIEAHKKDRPVVLFSSSKIHFALARMSYVYWYAHSALSNLLAAEVWNNYYLSYVDEQSSHWRRFVQIWEDILKLCKRNKIQPIVVILPYPNMLSDDHPFLATYRNVENISIKQGALVHNIFPAVKGHNPIELHVGVTDGHPSKRAHSIFAESIFAFLVKSDLLPK